MYHPPLSPLRQALYCAGNGMYAQNARMLVLSQNIAGAGTRAPAPGQAPYSRQIISFKSAFDKNIGTDVVSVNKITKDTAPFARIHMPDDPAADEDGYVLESNVNPIFEVTDLREAAISHEANLKAFERNLKALQKTNTLLDHNA